MTERAWYSVSAPVDHAVGERLVIHHPSDPAYNAPEECMNASTMAEPLVPVSDPGQEAGDLDAALVRAVADGDREAFRALYDRYGRMVNAVAFRVVNDRQLAEECVQDVFVELWQAHGGSIPHARAPRPGSARSPETARSTRFAAAGGDRYRRPT